MDNIKQLKKEINERMAMLQSKNVTFTNRQEYQEKTWELEKELQRLEGIEFNKRNKKV